MVIHSSDIDRSAHNIYRWVDLHVANIVISAIIIQSNVKNNITLFCVREICIFFLHIILDNTKLTHIFQRQSLQQNT